MYKRSRPRSTRVTYLNSQILATSEQDYDSRGIHEGTLVWDPKYFMNKFAHPSLASCLHLKIKKSSEEPKGVQSLWEEEVGHPFETYSTNGVLDKAEM